MPLHLPPDAFVDLEHAREAIHRAESAVAQSHWHRAWGASQGPLFTARRGFLPDEEAEWIRDVRHELDALYLRALECYAQACLGVSGTELAAADRAGRELTRLATYRESGYRHLMRALARSGNTAEALRTYDELRTQDLRTPGREAVASPEHPIGRQPAVGGDMDRRRPFSGQDWAASRRERNSTVVSIAAGGR